MLGIIYLILSVLIGYEISGILTGPKEISTDTNRIWLVLPASFGTGFLLSHGQFILFPGLPV